MEHVSRQATGAIPPRHPRRHRCSALACYAHDSPARPVPIKIPAVDKSAKAHLAPTPAAEMAIYMPLRRPTGPEERSNTVIRLTGCNPQDRAE